MPRKTPQRKYRRRNSTEYYYRQDVADKFDCAPITIKRMEKDGRLPPPIKLGLKMVVWPKAFLDKWIMASRGEPVAKPTTEVR
jgi:predicted DNA-binding transcriptional regulator AlpA